MTDTPISLLRIILDDYEPDCMCDHPDTCLHCRIEKVIEEHDKAEAERGEYWTRIQELKRELDTEDGERDGLCIGFGPNKLAALLHAQRTLEKYYERILNLVDLER